MTTQKIPLTEVNRRMKQIRQLAHSDGLVVLTSHDKPTLIVMEVERCRLLLESAEQLAQMLVANSLLEFARAIGVADAIGLGDDLDWLKRALDDLR